MSGLNFIPPLQPIITPLTVKYGVQLFLLRTDLNHEQISGNKLYKLHYNLEEANRLTKKTLLTFGGAFSNHIAATAAAGKEHGFKTIGIIRGERPEALNPTLRLAIENGMILQFVNREIYKQRNNTAFLEQLQQEYPDAYIIPEGGANQLGIKGCKAITSTIQIPFDVIACACGTGSTLAGISLSLQENQRALGFQVLKGEGYLKKEMGKWLEGEENQRNNWEICEDYHFGGYAKVSSDLIDFAVGFERQHGIRLDYVYTAKLMFGLFDLLTKNYFGRGQTIIAVHTGGLQGNQGFSYKIPI